MTAAWRANKASLFSNREDFEGRPPRRGEQPGELEYAAEEEVTLSPLPCWRAWSAEKIRARVSELVDEIEKEAIDMALDYTAGDKSRASRILNIGRKTLYRKLEQYENGNGSNP